MKNQLFCAGCGREVAHGCKFCPECGGKAVAKKGRPAKTGEEPVVIKYIDKLAYTVDEFSAAIGIGRGKIYEWMSTGRLAYSQIDGRRIIPRSDAEAFLTSHRVEAIRPLDKLVGVS